MNKHTDCESCGKPIDTEKLHYSIGTGYVHPECSQLGMNYGTKPGQREVATDNIAPLLDDLAALGEHWARNRAKKFPANGIRAAMIHTAQEIAGLVAMGNDIARRPV